MSTAWVAYGFLFSDTYLPRFNQQFGKAAAKRADVHRVVSDERLLRVLSLQEERVVQPDWTVRWQNGFLQLPRATARHVQPGDKLTVSEQLDGRLRIFAGDRELPWSTLREAPPRGATGSTQGQKPRASHPWRGRILRILPTPTANALTPKGHFYLRQTGDISNGLQQSLVDSRLLPHSNLGYAGPRFCNQDGCRHGM